MFGRMAIRAKYFEIAQAVVCAIAIFVMHAKNLDMLRIAASFTSGKRASFFQFLSYGRKSRLPNAVMGFVNTSSTAVFPSLRRRGQKFLITMNAATSDAALEMHGLVVTFCRTIFCYFFMPWRHEICGSTYDAYPFNPFIGRSPCIATFPRAVFEGFPSVFWDTNVNAALTARHHLGGHCYAT